MLCPRQSTHGFWAIPSLPCQHCALTETRPVPRARAVVPVTRGPHQTWLRCAPDWRESAPLKRQRRRPRRPYPHRSRRACGETSCLEWPPCSMSPRRRVQSVRMASESPGPGRPLTSRLSRRCPASPFVDLARRDYYPPQGSSHWQCRGSRAP